MIQHTINTASPFIIATAGINGITDTELGKSLLIIMALAVIVNQVWTVIEKIIDRIKTKPTDITGLAGIEICDERHLKINADIARVAADLNELRREMREDIKGVKACFEDVMKGVSRLEGRIDARKKNEY
jgi:hypothetical protein